MTTSTINLRKYRNYLVLKNYSEHTQRSYFSVVNSYITYVSKQAKDEKLSPQEYATNFILNKHRAGLSWSSINIIISGLLIYFKEVLGLSWDYSATPRPKMPKRLPTILTHKEITRLINSISNPKQQTLIIMCYATGLRIQELLSIKLTDIYSDRLHIKVVQGKGNKDRVVHISSSLLELLRLYFKKYRPKKYLFNGMLEESKYSSSSVRKILKRAAHKAGIKKKVHTHMLRHCFATHHLDFGTDIVFIKQQLGHKSLNVTAKYLHLSSTRRTEICHPMDQLDIAYRLQPMV